MYLYRSKLFNTNDTKIWYEMTGIANNRRIPLFEGKAIIFEIRRL